jgi:hypothetical protein
VASGMPEFPLCAGRSAQIICGAQKPLNDLK